MNKPTSPNIQQTILEKPQWNVIKRHPRNRQPLPSEPVKLQRPKQLQPPPPPTSWLTALPTIGMALMTGLVGYLSTGKMGWTIVPMIAMGGMTIGIQRYMGKTQQQKIDADNERSTQNFRNNERTTREDIDKSGQTQFRILHREKPPINDLALAVNKRATLIWERQPTDDDFLAVRIGKGVQPLSRPVQLLEPDDDDPRIAEANKRIEALMRVENLPITANLNVLSAVGLRGQRPSDAVQLVNTILLNIAVLHSPDEVQIYMISHRSDAAEAWGWMRWLPHTQALHGETTAHLSFSPTTDEEVLLPLSQELRRREDRMRQNRRTGPMGPHLVLLVDHAPQLQGHAITQMVLAQKPTEPEGRLAASILFIENPIPAQVNGMIEVKGGRVSFRETWAAGANQTRFEGEAELTQLSMAEQIGRQLAPLRSLESFNASGSGLPSNVRLVEILAGTGARVDDIEFERVYETKYDRRKVMAFPIGINRDEKHQYITLRETGQKGNGQHAILAGGTGKGKSITLQSIVVSLAATHSPKYLNFVLADFKGGSSELAKLQYLPHVVGFVTDLKPSYVERFRLALEGEITRRKKLFEETPQTFGQQITNIYDYNDLCIQKGVPFLPHLILVIDEFHKARTLNENFQKTMDGGVAAQGRALGMHLLLSTQKADDFGSVLPNIEVKMSVGMNRAEDSKAIFKRDEAFTMLKRPGQAYVQALDNEMEIFEMFQAARCDTDYVPDGEEQVHTDDNFVVAKIGKDGRRHTLYEHVKKDKEAEAQQAATKQARLSEAEVLVERIRHYCQEHNYAPMSPVCLDALVPAEQLPLQNLLQEQSLFRPWTVGQWTETTLSDQRLKLPIGMLDLPEQQKQIVHGLDFNQGDGNLLVVGPQGAGKVVLVRSVLLGLALAHTPADWQFYILARGPGLTVFEAFPHCGGIVRTASEKERFGRALNFMSQTIEQRRQLMGMARVDNMAQLRERRSDLSLPAIFLIVEDMSRVREDYEEQANDFQKLAAEAKAADLHLIIVNNSMQGIPAKLGESLSNRIALGLKSTADYVEVLNKRAEVADELLGRGYLIHEGEAREFQAAAPTFTDVPSVVGAAVGDALRQIGQEMAQSWQGLSPAKIESLASWIDLEELWQVTERPPLTYANLQTAPLGLEYDNLTPVFMDPMLMDPVTLVTGPKGSGKTEWVLTFCFAAADKLDPEQIEIVLISYDPQSPLRQLRNLPQVTYIGLKKQLEKLDAIQTDAQARQQEYAKQQEVMQERTTQFLVGNRVPKYTIVIVESVQNVLKGTPAFSKQLEPFLSNDLCRVILVDITPNFESIKQDYANPIAGAIKRTGSYAFFTSDEPTFNLLGSNVRITTPMKRLHGNQIGKGRAYFSYNNETSVVQFATLQPKSGDKTTHIDRLKQMVQHISQKFVVENPIVSNIDEPQMDGGE